MSRFSLFALVLPLTLACSGQSWSSLADCEGLSPGPNADECWAAHSAELFRADPANGEKVVEEKVQDQRVRDFIWLTVTREVDPGSFKYCEKIQEAALQERCRVLVSRPHLHRELTGGGAGGDGPKGAGGGPPPGGGGPPGQGGPSQGAQGGPPPGGGPPDAGGAPPAGAGPDGGAGAPPTAPAPETP